jgi:hypothetical protein
MASFDEMISRREHDLLESDLEGRRVPCFLTVLALDT